MSTPAASPSLRFPERVSDSMTGSAFGASITTLPANAARERAILQQLTFGNVPSFMQESRLITVRNARHTAVFEVLPDVLCVGSDADFLRVPVTPMAAQTLCDLLGGTLPTPFLVDQIWKQADVVLDPATMPPTDQMSSTDWFVGHNAKIEWQRAGARGLVAGHKKAVVLTNHLLLPVFAGRVAIYGWHYKATGRPIQGLNPYPGMPRERTHVRTYLDYSHGAWIVAQRVLLDDAPTTFAALAANPDTADLVNGPAGPLRFLRYDTE